MPLEDERTRRWLLRSGAVAGAAVIAGCTGDDDGGTNEDTDPDGGGEEQGSEDESEDDGEGDDSEDDGEGDDSEDDGEGDESGDDSEDDGEEERPLSDLIITAEDIPGDDWTVSVAADEADKYSLVFSRSADGVDHTLGATVERHESADDAAANVETARSSAEKNADVQSADVGDDGFAFLDEERDFSANEGAYVTFHVDEVVGHIEYYAAEDGESIVPSLEDAVGYAESLESTITGTD